jgi:hypothetical protein
VIPVTTASEHPETAQMAGESPFARQHTGTPLSALFLLTAIIAVLLGLAGIASRTFDFWSDGWVERAFVAVAAAFCLGGLGAIRGLFCFDRAINVALGIVSGGTIGIVSAALLYASSEDRAELVAVATVGALVIVAVAAGIRRQSDPS